MAHRARIIKERLLSLPRYFPRACLLRWPSHAREQSTFQLTAACVSRDKGCTSQFLSHENEIKNEGGQTRERQEWGDECFSTVGTPHPPCTSRKSHLCGDSSILFGEPSKRVTFTF